MPPRRRLSASGLACLALSLAAAATASGQHEDLVVLRTSSGGQRTLRCEVLEYTGGRLLVRTAQGVEYSYRGDEIVEVQPQLGPAHQAAREALAARRWGDALTLIRQAEQEETRAWVKRELLAERVRSHACVGELAQAGSVFELLYQSDPATPYFDRIPLTWTPRQVAPDVQRLALDWTAPGKPGAVRLMGASWLLTGPQRAAAEGVLRELLNDPDARTVQLAVAQQWRARAVVATAEETEQWREQLRRLPPSLRGGPDFIVGVALARLGQPEEAALLLMRAPIEQPAQFVLASECLLAAAAQLEKLGRLSQAATLYAELLRDYSQTNAAAAARSRLEQLEDPASPR